jgi:hypothetical protein
MANYIIWKDNLGALKQGALYLNRERCMTACSRISEPSHIRFETDRDQVNLSRDGLS